MVPSKKNHYRNIFQGYEAETIGYMLGKKIVVTDSDVKNTI